MSGLIQQAREEPALLHLCDANRIAAALLAAEELAEAIDCLAEWQNYDASRAAIPGTHPPEGNGCMDTDDAKSRLASAYDAYREAVK